MAERAILIVSVGNATVTGTSREEAQMLLDIVDRLDLEIERRGANATPLARTLALCCCFSCCCSN